MDTSTALEIGAAVITVIAALYGVLFFIDKRIENRIRDDAFLRKLASALRPSGIFDHKGSVLIRGRKGDIPHFLPAEGWVQWVNELPTPNDGCSSHRRFLHR